MKNEVNLKNQMKYWRKRRGYTIEGLAAEAKVSTATIIRMEREENYIPRPAVINKLTDRLGITVDQLIVDESETEQAA